MNIISMVLFFNIYIQNQNLFLMQAKVYQGYSTQIRGRNFYGHIQLTAKALNLDLTQFKKGGFYTVEINDLDLQKEFKRFLIFKKVNDLFGELVQNQRLQISDQNTLIVPIDITYKSRRFELKIQIPLMQKKFNNQGQKMQNLFQTIERINKEKIKMERLLPQLISFKGDISNQKYSSYEVSEDSKRIIKVGKDQQWTCFNHFLQLKSKGIFYFKAKIIKTSVNKYMFFGVCTRQIQSKLNSDLYYSPFFMGLILTNGNLYGNGKNSAAASGYTIVEGESVIKVEIDMSSNIISWFHNEAKLYSTGIAKQLAGLTIFPMVSLYTNGDSIEFMDE